MFKPRPVGPTQRRPKNTDMAAIADMTLNSRMGDLDVSNIHLAQSPIKPPTISKSKGSTDGGVMKTLLAVWALSFAGINIPFSTNACRNVFLTAFILLPHQRLSCPLRLALRIHGRSPTVR